RYRMFPIIGTVVITAAMILLAQLQVGTSLWIATLDSLVLGVGLGLVMQVLILAVQNSVDPSMMGVATSGATLFRQLGGSIGVAVMGSIFANRVRTELASRLPHGVAVPKTVSPAAIQHLPAAAPPGLVDALA